MHLTFATSVETAGSLGRVLSRNSDRPWQELWRSILRRLRELEDAYAGTLPGPEPADWTTLPVDFCKDCFHLKDWIRSDTARVPTSAQGGAADQYARKEPAIALAGAVCNTSKHRTRRAGQTKAHVARVELDDNGAAFTIAWEQPDGTTGTRDALELARAAVEGWQQFLHDHKMDEKGG
ncbi:hypothetical protein [Streptomyces sp. NPDC088736]|uniref:hypothetical protein n=1 Tax=Streptomyces sp. NPDC088736 TaxID=3365881 RepID=UPI00382F3A8C